MFEKSIAALKVAEQAVAEELAALWVPWDPTTNSGAVYWHGAAASILQDAGAAVANLRATFEAKEPPVAEASAEVPAEAPAVEPEGPETAVEAPTEVPTEAPAEETPEEVLI